MIKIMNLSVGLASVGLDGVNACRSLRQPDIQDTYIVYFIWYLAVGLGGEPFFRTRGIIGSRSAYGVAPMMQLHSSSFSVSGSDHTGEQFKSFDALPNMHESTPDK